MLNNDAPRIASFDRGFDAIGWSSVCGSKRVSDSALASGPVARAATFPEFDRNRKRECDLYDTLDGSKGADMPWASSSS
jgi:hypothetical protein